VDFAYFALIYAWMVNKIDDFTDGFMHRTVAWASAIGLTLFTVWIIVQGFRILTGRSREPMMAMVVDMSRNALILMAAAAMGLGGRNIQTFFTTTLASDINELVTGSDASPVSAIDRNLAYATVAMGAIDSTQGLSGSVSGDNVASTTTTAFLAALGVAGPPITAGAMLLMYKVALALFVGLGPIFICCLMFKATEQMFWRWLNYGLGTLFSLAVLSLMTSIVLDLTLRVAGALWASSAISAIANVDGGGGLTGQALQQGGVGMLMTVLLITAPPMAASFFGGTVGSFTPYSALGGAGQPGPQGQPVGSYRAPNTELDGPSNRSLGFPNNSSARGPTLAPVSDSVKPHQGANK